MKRILLLIYLFTATAYGGMRDPINSDDRHLSYGSKFKYVLKLKTKRTDTKDIQLSSCVLISKDHFITAAHVAYNTDEWSVYFNDREIPVKNISLHPDFSDDKVDEFDIAVGRLSESIALDFYPALYEEDDEQDKVVSISGFGLSGVFSGKELIMDSKRRAGSNIIESIEGQTLVCNISDQRRTELEFCIAPGDSGGGLFIGNRLAGINSLVRSSNKPLRYNYGDESVHTRISSHRPWIMEQIDNREEYHLIDGQ